MKEINYQLEKLGLSDLENDIEIIVTTQYGVYEPLKIVYEDLELRCSMKWDYGIFRVAVNENELKSILATKPFHILTNEDILDAFDFELIETQSGNLVLKSLNDEIDEEEILSEIRKSSYEWDEQTNLEEIVYDIYDKGSEVYFGEYIFNGLRSLEVVGGGSINHTYWAYCIDEARKLIDKGINFETAKTYLQDFVKWEDDGNKVGEAYYLIGEINYHTQDWKEAVECYKKARSAGYETLQLFLRLGWSLMQVNEFEHSIEAYERAVALSPNNSPSHYMIGILKAHIGDNEGALLAYNECLNYDPQNADAYTRRGDVFIKDGKLDEAKADFEKVIELDDQNGYAYYRLGLINSDQKAFKDGATNLGKALNLDERMQSDHTIWSSKAWCEYKSEQYGEAVTSYSKALEFHAEALYHYWRGNSFSKQGLYDRAIEDFNSSLQLNPSHKFSLYELGKVQSNLEAYADAVATQSKAIDIDPNYKWAIYERGKAYVKLGKYDDAIEDFDRTAALDSTWIWPLVEKGRVLMMKQNATEALDVFGKVLELEPDATWLLSDRGKAFHLVHEYQKALEDYQNTSNIEGDLCFFYNVERAKNKQEIFLLDEYELLEKGDYDMVRAALEKRAKITFYKSGSMDEKSSLDYTNALIKYAPEYANGYYIKADWLHTFHIPKNEIEPLLQKCLELDPNHLPALMLYGRIADTVDASIANFSKAVSIDPGNASALSYLGNRLKENGQFDKAIPHLVKSSEIKPMALTFQDLGFCYLKTRAYHDAVTALETAISMNKFSIDAYYFLSEIYFHFKNKEKALEYIEEPLRDQNSNHLTNYYRHLRKIYSELYDDNNRSKAVDKLIQFLDNCGGDFTKQIEFINTLANTDPRENFDFLAEYRTIYTNQLKLIFDEGPYKAKIGVTKNPNLYANPLKAILETDISFTPAENICAHPKLSDPEYLKVVIEKDDESYGYSYRLIGCVRNGSCTDEIRKRLLKHKYRWVRKAAAQYLESITPEIMNMNDYYVIKGLLENVVLKETDKSSLENRLDKLSSEETMYRVVGPKMTFMEVVAGEVEMDEFVDVVMNESEYDSWSDYTQDTWYDFGDSVYGTDSFFNSLELESGEKLELPQNLVALGSNDLDYNIKVSEGELMHFAVSYEAGQLDYPSFTLEMEFRPEYLYPIADDENFLPVITGYEYNNPKIDSDTFEIVVELLNSTTKDVIREIYLGTSDGKSLLLHIDELRAEMRNQGLKPESKEDIDSYIQTLIAES